MKLNGRYIPVRTNKQTVKILLGEVIFVEKDCRRVVIHTEEETFSFYGKMSDIIRFIDGRFLFTHQSYIFNMDQIRMLHTQTIYMEKGHEVTVGRESFRRIRKAFDEYLDKSIE
ncbi:MAG: LytTR family DNA-binding domain-containing protein [Anaerovoracaceae bacterium]